MPRSHLLCWVGGLGKGGMASNRVYNGRTPLYVCVQLLSSFLPGEERLKSQATLCYTILCLNSSKP